MAKSKTTKVVESNGEEEARTRVLPMYSIVIVRDDEADIRFEVQGLAQAKGAYLALKAIYGDEEEPFTITKKEVFKF